MPRVYCQNEDCSFWKNLKLYKNYGKCTKRELYMTCSDEETNDESMPKIACPHSNTSEVDDDN